MKYLLTLIFLLSPLLSASDKIKEKLKFEQEFISQQQTKAVDSYEKILAIFQKEKTLNELQKLFYHCQEEWEKQKNISDENSIYALSRHIIVELIVRLKTEDSAQATVRLLSNKKLWQREEALAISLLHCHFYSQLGVKGYHYLKKEKQSPQKNKDLDFLYKFFTDLNEDKESALIITNAQDKLAKIKTDFRLYNDENIYHQDLHQQVESSVSLLKTPTQFRALFFICLKEKERFKAQTIKDISPHKLTLNSILYQLAKIDDLKATELLVDLWALEGIWDGETALLSSDAVLQAGKKALRFLEQKKNRPTENLIRYIHEGQKHYL